MFTSIILNTSA